MMETGEAAEVKSMCEWQRWVLRNDRLGAGTGKMKQINVEGL